MATPIYQINQVSNFFTQENQNPELTISTLSNMSDDIPQGDVMDNDYKSRTGQGEVPVQSDDTPVEDPIDAATADSDEQLGQNSLEYALNHCLLPFKQRMTRKPLMRAISLEDVLVELNPVGVMPSQAMMKVFQGQVIVDRVQFPVEGPNNASGTRFTSGDMPGILRNTRSCIDIWDFQCNIIARFLMR
jgi:hypothetical protein